MIDKESAFNWEECSQNNVGPYSVILTTINNFSQIIVDPDLLQTNNGHTF